MHIKIAEKNAKQESPENLQKSVRSYEDALALFKDMKSKEDIQIVAKKLEELKQKVAEYDPFAT